MDYFLGGGSSSGVYFLGRITVITFYLFSRF